MKFFWTTFNNSKTITKMYQKTIPKPSKTTTETQQPKASTTNIQKRVKMDFPLGFPDVFFNSLVPRYCIDSNGVNGVNGHILHEPASEVPWTAGHGSVTCDVIPMPLILNRKSWSKKQPKVTWLKIMDN